VLTKSLTDTRSNFTGEVYNQFINQVYTVVEKASTVFDQSFGHLMALQNKIAEPEIAVVKG